MSTNLAALRSAVNQVRQRVTGRGSSPRDREEEMFRRELQLTMEAWQYAENHFREATDQDLIDQAAYDLLSAKARYAYLLKQARSRGLSL